MLIKLLLTVSLVIMPISSLILQEIASKEEGTDPEEGAN